MDIFCTCLILKKQILNDNTYKIGNSRRDTNTYLVWKKWDWDEGEIDQIPYKIWEIRGKAKKER